VLGELDGADLAGADQGALLEGGQVVEFGHDPTLVAAVEVRAGEPRDLSGSRGAGGRRELHEGAERGEQLGADLGVGGRVDVDGRLGDGDVLDHDRTGDAGGPGGVAVLLGSYRAGSLNRRIAEHLRDNAPAGVVVDVVEGIDAIPFYNEELDGETAPASATALRESVATADRVLAVTPEYNGTMPAVLNNAIDWLSRPYGQGAIVGKPFAAIGATPTPYGGKWSHEHARHSATIAGAVVVEGIVVDEPAVDGDPLENEAAVQRFLGALDALVAHEVEFAA
jgi:NAD(P)H-dependent FMN reductase